MLKERAVTVPVPHGPSALCFDNVSMQYIKGRPAALDGVSFVLPAGKRLCVMGPSGSGKSTLAKLACRLYDPTGGHVQFDGIGIDQFAIPALREYVGVVSQESLIFSGTIGENIRYGSEDAPHKSVIAAARFAQIHDFIEEQPLRYHTPTHERGLALSGGQKQRVRLARALLYDPKFLVLDDFTSAVDALTEAQLIESGLLIKPDDPTRRDQSSYDRFRGRVTFPITDRRGRVIAFGARTLGDNQPKYLNSPDTPLFHKGQVLYGLANAWAASREENRVIVTEGYMDVISLVRAGIKAAVAPLGTALTEAQIPSHTHDTWGSGWPTGTWTGGTGTSQSSVTQASGSLVSTSTLRTLATGSGSTHTHTWTGTSTAVDTVPPYLVVKYIIKT